MGSNDHYYISLFSLYNFIYCFWFLFALPVMVSFAFQYKYTCVLSADRSAIPWVFIDLCVCISLCLYLVLWLFGVLVLHLKGNFGIGNFVHLHTLEANFFEVSELFLCFKFSLRLIWLCSIRWGFTLRMWATSSGLELLLIRKLPSELQQFTWWTRESTWCQVRSWTFLPSTCCSIHSCYECLHLIQIIKLVL